MAGRVIAAGPPAVVLTNENLLTAYGLGGLHRNEDADPTTEHHHHDHDHGDHSHDHGH